MSAEQSLSEYDVPFISTCISEAQTAYYDARVRVQQGLAKHSGVPQTAGSLYRDFNTLYAAIDARGQQLLPQFPASMRRAFAGAYSFMDGPLRERYDSLEYGDAVAAMRLRDFRSHATSELNERNQAKLGPQTLPSDLLGMTPYVKQDTDGACVATGFMMIAKALLPQAIHYKLPMQAGLMYNVQRNRMYREPTCGDALYLHILQSPTFRAAAGGMIEAKTVVGADFNDITRNVLRWKAAHENADVYAMVDIGSTSHRATRLDWHRMVLLGANEEYVTCHDPNPHIGEIGAKADIPKWRFNQRWGIAMNRAHLICAYPSDAVPKR